jgi:hypothetical protein
MDHTKKEGKKDAGLRVDVEPCVLALHRGSAGPALVPPSHEMVFFFALASAFFFPISFVFHRLVVGCCCYGGACAFSDVEAEEFKKQKSAFTFLLACRLESLAALLFLFSFCSLVFGTE